MFDYLIHNARILDGSGAPARQGDVALSGGHIAAVGHLTERPLKFWTPGAGISLPAFWTSTVTPTMPFSAPAGGKRSWPRG